MSVPHDPVDLSVSELLALRQAFAEGEVALFLDVDGTLLEIAQRPENVRVSGELHRLIALLAQQNDQAVAFVSGRTIADLDRLFAPLQLPTAGLHGVERRDARGRIHRIDRSADLHDVRQYLSEKAYDGVFVEDKHSAIVLHYRGRPELARNAGALAGQALPHARGDWLVVPGKMSFEIRPADVNKSDAIRAFLEEAPFRERKAAFFGDDVGDEDGFAYVNTLGGWTVHVGEGRNTCARFLVAEPRAVWNMLTNLLEDDHIVKKT